MSLKYLGSTIDIHGGGQDLVFPHHENEIAQSESFTGIKPFVKYWLHNGLMQLDEEKMSKSLGNMITIKEAVEKYSPDAIRIFVLSSHYRSPLTYSEEALEAAEKGADRLREAVHGEGKREKDEGGIDTEAYRQRFIDAMDDDFNTPQAIATLFDLARDINRLSDEGYSVIPGQQLLLELANILGLTLEPREELPLDAEYIARTYALVYQELGRVPAYNDKSDAERMIYDLVEMRQELRKGKQWQQADMVRNKLDEVGIALEDTPQGTVWKRKR
jgi:cysteinyl-tRNA synthetase